MNEINTNKIEKSKKYINDLKDHILNTNSNIKYSLDRFDILIISLSSGGLVFSMGFIKDILPDDIDINYTLLKLSWIFFGTSILSNLFSQVTGYFANKLEVKISKNLIREERGELMLGDQNKLGKSKGLSNSSTYFFNGISLLLTILAVVLLVIFMSINLK